MQDLQVNIGPRQGSLESGGMNIFQPRRGTADDHKTVVDGFCPARAIIIGHNRMGGDGGKPFAIPVVERDLRFIIGGGDNAAGLNLSGHFASIAGQFRNMAAGALPHP